MFYSGLRGDPESAVIVSFCDKESKAIFNGTTSKAARKRLPLELWKNAQRKLDQMRRVTRLDQLAVPPGNRLESLGADRAGQHSIRINDQYRICFIWTHQGPAKVEVTDYH